MTAVRIGILAVFIIAAATYGSSRGFDPSTDQSIEASLSFSGTPLARVVSSDDESDSLVEIVLPGDDGAAKVFKGAIGLYDQVAFEKGLGTDKESREALYVVSLDKSAETLVSVYYRDGEADMNGYAYVFKRKDINSPYELAWSSPGMTSTRAIDVDTFMENHQVSVADAMNALGKSAPELAMRPRADLASAR